MIAPHLRPWRTLLHVLAVDGDQAITAIPGWSSTELVRIPAALFPMPPTPNSYFFAHVNTGASSASDLTFERFEVAPDVDPRDDF